MRVLIIGGTGHIGRYLVEHFVGVGAEVVVVARGATGTGPSGGDKGRADFWNKVKIISLDRQQAQQQLDADRVQTKWQSMLREVTAEIVIDLIAFHLEDTRQTIEAVRPRAAHFINVGTGWRFGRASRLPTKEDDRADPQSDYGAQKQLMWEMIDREFRLNGFPGTQIDPPAIQGAPKIPNTPTGLRLLDVHQEIADGRKIRIPGTGETLLGMVHVSDVAQMIQLAVEQRDRAAGQAFNASSDFGLTYNGLFYFLRDLFGSQASAEYTELDEFERLHPERTGRHHILHHQLLSNEKARRTLGFTPRNDLFEILRENFRYLVNSGRLKAVLH